MKIYLLPGLGFDHRIFRKLDLKDYDFTYLDWIEPLPKEPIRAYAQRMGKDLDDQSGKTVLIGHSLGGIISQEIACFKKIDTIILISSIRSRAEMPALFKAVHPMRIQKVFTKGLALNTFFFWAEGHDYVSPEEQALFQDMVRQQTNTYLQWALKSLSQWQTPALPPFTTVIQIHGDNDKTFPLSLLEKPDHVIPGGGHFMVYRLADEVSRLICEIITNETRRI